MEQVFRIEIPVEVKSNADMGKLKQIEAVLKEAEQEARKLASSADSALSKISSGASSAASSMQQVDSAAKQSADALEDIGDSADKAGDAAEDAADSMEEIGDAAKEAGSAADDALSDAASSADKFSQRMEKSGKTLREAFKEKVKLTMEAIDKISPVVQEVTAKVKSLAAKAWRVTLKAVDLVTAPFKALKNMIMSPITMTLSIAGIGLGASSFYQTFTEFEAGMSNVKALSGATNEEFIKLKDTASELGATTKFTAAEASEGMQYLAMAGWKTSDIIAGMPGLLQLAAAGSTDLGTAADIVSDVMTAMGMSADQATRAADIFARTATSTNTTISMMGETLKYAAPVAHSFGLELSEVAAVTGMMANAGIKGGSAGTAIRTALLRMASPSSEAAKAMKALGLTFSDSTGKMKNMQTIMKDLGGAFGKLSEQEKLAYANDIFGKNAASAWLAVIEQGESAFNELYEAIDKSEGAAQEMADTQLDNLTGDVTLLQSAVDGMKVSLMDKLNPYLRQGVQWITAKIPEITEALGNLIDSGISKAKQLKETISGVFSSAEFQNADSIADKLFIAWDKIIAEPFNNWWSGSGRAFVLGIVKKVGTTFGEVLHGIITGIFAALKGEEIDFEGLNLTGIAKAGAEAAKEYVSSFAQGLNASDLMGSMPGWMSAGLVGFGALKVGSGAHSIASTIRDFRQAFTGIGSAAPVVTTAMSSVGEAAATAATSAATGTSAFGGLGTALAAIPGWGWAALAALTAVGIGVKLYTDKQERQRQALLHLSDDVDEAADRYVKAAKKAQDVHAAFDEVKEIQIKIEEGGKNEETVKRVREEIDGINDRKIWLEARLADTTLTPTEIESYKAELEKIQSREEYLEAQLASGTLTPAQVSAYQAELEKLKGKDAELSAALASGTLTATDIATYQEELDRLHGNNVELKATLEKSGYNIAEVALIEMQLNAFQEGEKKAAVMIANNSTMSADQVTAYVTEMEKIATKKAELEIKKSGIGMTPGQIAQYKEQLAGIRDRKADIEVALKEGEGSMKKSEWDALVSEYNDLTAEGAKITLWLEGSEMNEQEVKDLDDQISELQEKASNIMLQIAENSDMSEDDLNDLAGIFRDMGDMNVLLNFGLTAGSLTKEDLEQYNAQLKDLYGNISELTGGAFTQEDLESGAATQQQVEEYMLADARASRTELAEKIQYAERQAPAAIEQRDALREKYEAKESDISNAQSALSTLKAMQRDSDDLQAQRRMQLDSFKNGDITYDQYASWTADTYEPAIEAMQKRWSNEIAPLLETSEGYNMTGTDAPTYFDFEELGGFQGALNDLESYIADEAPRRDKYKSDYEAQNQELVDLYQDKKKLVEANAFNDDARYAGNSLEEMAAQYGALDDAGRKMFESALQGLAELNQQTDSITDAEKTNTADITAMAVQSVEAQANTDVVSGIQKQLMEMQSTYQKLGEAGREAWNTGDLERLNSELADLNLEPLESLDTVSLETLQSVLSSLGSDTDLSGITDMGEAINTAMEALAGVDPSSIDFSTAASSLESLGGNADDVKSKVDTVKAAMDELNAKTVDGAKSSISGVGSTANTAASSVGSVKTAMHNLNGTKATVDIYIQKHGNTNVALPHAEGGILSSPHVGLVAEDGPEAIIPLGGKRRERGLDLWMQAGRMLGVGAYAEGGILGPYADTFASIPESVWDDDGNGSGDPKPMLTGNGSGGGGTGVTVEVTVNPEYTIDGGNGDPEAILEILRAKQDELAELLGGAMANQLADLLTNM